MVKCFYLEENGYPEEGYRKSKFIDICVAGLGNRGLYIKDRENEITDKDIKKYKLIDVTEEYDTFRRYIIEHSTNIEKFIKEKRCKVLCKDASINEDSVIEVLLEETKI